MVWWWNGLRIRNHPTKLLLVRLRGRTAGVFLRVFASTAFTRPWCGRPFSTTVPGRCSEPGREWDGNPQSKWRFCWNLDGTPKRTDPSNTTRCPSFSCRNWREFTAFLSNIETKTKKVKSNIGILFHGSDSYIVELAIQKLNILIK